jgi:hypothetical protein
MQIEVLHPEFRSQRITVEPAGNFSGPKLLLNGTVVKKQKGRYVVTSDSGTETTIQLRCNYLDPIPKIKINGEVTEIASPLRWYEYFWIIPFVLVATADAIGGLGGFGR